MPRYNGIFKGNIGFEEGYNGTCLYICLFSKEVRNSWFIVKARILKNQAVVLRGHHLLDLHTSIEVSGFINRAAQEFPF